MMDIIFNYRHKYHITCLAAVGCSVVSNFGEQTWYCYLCMQAKNQGTSEVSHPKANEESSHNLSQTSKPELDEDMLQNIMDQRVAKAREYLSAYKQGTSPLLVLEQMNRAKTTDPSEVEEEKQKLEALVNEQASIFDRPEFALKLWAVPHDSQS